MLLSSLTACTDDDFGDITFNPTEGTKPTGQETPTEPQHNFTPEQLASQEHHPEHEYLVYDECVYTWVTFMCSEIIRFEAGPIVVKTLTIECPYCEIQIPTKEISEYIEKTYPEFYEEINRIHSEAREISDLKFDAQKIKVGQTYGTIVGILGSEAKNIGTEGNIIKQWQLHENLYVISWMDADGQDGKATKVAISKIPLDKSGLTAAEIHDSHADTLDYNKYIEDYRVAIDNIVKSVKDGTFLSAVFPRCSHCGIDISSTVRNMEFESRPSTAE